MNDNLTDQQRADQVRNWFAENGWYILAGLVLGLGGLFGWRQWAASTQVTGEEASALYEEMVGAMRVGRVVRAEEIAAQLARDYSGTPYLDQARLAMARIKLERGVPAEAISYLELVARESGSEGMVNIARLRLGRVLIQEEKYEDALKALQVPKDSAFESRYREARGDAYYAMGRNADAAVEYEAALAQAEQVELDPAFLRAKLDEARGAAPAGATAATAGE